MSNSAPAPLRAAIARLSAYYDTTEIADDLLRHLVSTVYGARAPLYGSMAQAIAMTAVVWAITGGWLFGAQTVGHLIVGLARVDLLRRYRVAGGVKASREATLELDNKFAFWSTAFALLLGFTCLSVLASGEWQAALPLVVGAAVGFPIAFVARHSGRPRLLAQQIVAMTAPVFVGFLVAPIAYGACFAALLFGFVVCAFALGHSNYVRLVKHFAIDETNRRLARYDTLTGLLNRRAFNDALARELRSDAADPAERFALIAIDLDRFKDINDAAGHTVGDAVIVETANRLRKATRPTDVVARLGGDEFVVLARSPGLSRRTFAELAGVIVDALRESIEVDGVALPITASVGVAVFPDHGDNAAELMKRSDIALYEAKRAGRGRFSVFDQAMQARIDEAMTLEIEMQRALREDQFEAWLQPIYDIESNRPVGYEALARWRHPTRGLVPPGCFIPQAEQSGVIVDIGRIILDKACRAAAGWDSDLAVAVNLSPVEFRRPAELVRNIRETLRRSRLDPSRLFIEITESLMLEDSEQTRAAVRQIAALGVRFALDDFGAGYSSLSYIQDYPFSKIKIDRKFIERIDSDAVSSAIVASVCVLAERTSMEVVAEGVENRAQEQALRRLGVRQAQGYLYGRPAPQAPQAAPLPLAAAS